MKQYILSIFLLSTAISLNAMQEEKKESSDPRTKVEWSLDGKRIVASHEQISCDGYFGDYTTVIKNVATGTFDVEAWRSMFGVGGGATMKQTASQTMVERLKKAIAEFEK